MIGGLDIFFDKAELAAIESLRRYLDEQLEPELAAHGEDFVPKDKMQSWTQKLAEFGLVNAPQPESAGGLGLSWKLHVQLIEELAYSSGDLAIAALVNGSAASMLVKLAP